MTNTPDDTEESAATQTVDAERRRQIRRRQMLLAIGALLAILIFAMIQGWLGAPAQIPGIQVTPTPGAPTPTPTPTSTLR